MFVASKVEQVVCHRVLEQDTPLTLPHSIVSGCSEVVGGAVDANWLPCSACPSGAMATLEAYHCHCGNNNYCAAAVQLKLQMYQSTLLVG